MPGPDIFENRIFCTVSELEATRAAGRRARIYQLLRTGELESIVDGARRLIFVASVRARIDRLVAASANVAAAAAPPHRRSRPRKVEHAEAANADAG